MDFSRVIDQATPLLLSGLRVTVVVSVASIVIGIVVGLVACLMGMAKFPLWRWISNAYVWVIRGTPMIVQAFFFFFGLPEAVSIFVPGFKLSIMEASIITVSLNAGAYLTEIFRGGINAVPKGQSEAARSLGLSQWKTMQKVVLPQAFRITLPSMVNQFIITIKEPSRLSVIGLPEIVNRGKVYVGSSYQFFATYIYVAFFYLVILSILMIISKKLEESISYDKKN